MNHIQNLKELSEAFGISGYEDEVVEILKKKFSKHTKMVRDGIGSIIAQKNGTSEKPKIMFAAHMDEIGFMVKEITKEGFIKFVSLPTFLQHAAFIPPVPSMPGKLCSRMAFSRDRGWR
jgi:endoglucanase